MKTGGERSRWPRSKTSHSPSLISTSKNTSAGRTICTEYLLNACLWEPTTSCMGKRQQGAKCNMAPLVRFIGDGDKPQQSSQKPEGGGHGPQQPEVCNQALPADPVTSVVSKKRASGLSTTHCYSHSPGNTPARLRSLPNTMATART